MKPKLVIINRAVPGSGKTTALKTIELALREEGLDTQKDFAVHSTDEFFMVGERYDFDIEKLNDYHKKNEENFETSLKNDTSVVVCDNTNILPWQCEAYTNLARKYGYKIAFLNIEPKSLAEHKKTQEVTPENPSAHQVPEDILERNIEEWRIYNDLFKIGQRISINPLRHRHFIWDSKKLCRVDTGELANYFECDYVISLPSWWDKDELKKELKSVIQGQIPWRFDCVIHTYDKLDSMSLKWGLKTLLANKHIILCPNNTNIEAIKTVVKNFSSSSTVEICEADMYNKNEIEKIMREKGFGKKVAFHLSGGSKVMFVVGQNVAKDLEAKAFVIDLDKFNILLLNDCKAIGKIPASSKVKDFLVGNTYGLHIMEETNAADIQKHKTLTRALFANKGSINALTTQICQQIKNDKKHHKMSAENFTLSNGNLEVAYNQTTLKISISNDVYEMSRDSSMLLGYIIGGWFEEFLYLELIPLVQSGYIYDLQINTKLSTKKSAYQEFDIVFTDGYKLFIVECKSGSVTTQAIEKLANIKQRYGEMRAICIIATAFAGQNEVIKMKAEENGLHLIYDNYRQRIKDILTIYIN